MLDPSLDTPDRMYTVLDFWERAALAYRGDGTRQAWDTGTATPYDATQSHKRCSPGTVPVDDDAAVARSSGSTPRSSTTCSSSTSTPAPATATPARTPCPATRSRRCSCATSTGSSQSDFWWSDVAASVPYHNLTAAFVLDDVDFTVTDFGTSNHKPEDYLDHVVAFGLFTTDGCAPSELRAGACSTSSTRSWPPSAPRRRSTTGASPR